MIQPLKERKSRASVVAQGKESTCQSSCHTGDTDSIPGLGRSHMPQATKPVGPDIEPML